MFLLDDEGKKKEVMNSGAQLEELSYSVDAALQVMLGDQYDHAETLVMRAAAATSSTTGENDVSGKDSASTSNASSPRSASVDVFPTKPSITTVPETTGRRMQRELNKARETLAATPHALAAKQRRIALLSRTFTNRACAVVKQHVLRHIAGGTLHHHNGDVQPLFTLKGHMNQQRTPAAPSVQRCSTSNDFSFWEPFTQDGLRFVPLFQPGTVQAHAEQIQLEILEVRRLSRQQAKPVEGTQDALPPDQIALSIALAFERVRKAARREVKARSEIMSMHHMESYAQVPLCTTVDYMGFSFFVDVDVGLSSKTLQSGLIYGAEEQFHRTLTVGEAQHNTRLADHVHRAYGVTFSLKSHPKAGVSTYGPVDLQVHLGEEDGILYSQCCRRVSPPILKLHGGLRPPSSMSSTSSLCQTAGCRMLSTFCENFCDPQQAFSPDVWLDEPARSVDSGDMECLAANQAIHDKAIPLVSEVLVIIDVILQSEGYPPSSEARSNGLPQRIRDRSMLLDTEQMARRWLSFLNPNTLKHLLHAYGVNMCFLGRVLETVETILFAISSSRGGPTAGGSNNESQMERLKAIKQTKLEPPSAASVNAATFVAAHPVLQIIRTEISARAMRAVVHAQLRHEAWMLSQTAASQKIDERRSEKTKAKNALTPFVNEETKTSAVLDVDDAEGGLGSGLNSTVGSLHARRPHTGRQSASSELSPMMRRIHDKMSECMCDLLCRCAGELLSSQGDDDKALWETFVLPMIEAMFGARMTFARVDRSAIGGAEGGSGACVDISTASRIRTRAFRREEYRGIDEMEKPKPIQLSNVDFSPWGQVADPQYAPAMPREAYALRAADKVTRLHMTSGKPATADARSTQGIPQDASPSASSVVDDSFLLIPRDMIQQERKRYEFLIDVQLGACQDYRIVRRVCQMLNSWVERRKDSPSGVSCHVDPQTVELCCRSPLSAESLQLIANGRYREVESMILEELKDRKARQAPTSSDANLLRLYHQLALTHLLAGRLQQASEWFRKMRDSLVRDIGSNELGQSAFMILECKVETLRKHFNEAIDLATHASSSLQFIGKDTQLYAQSLMALLDGIDAVDSASSSTRARKAELARQLVPYCYRFGMAVGRVAAREAIGRLQAVSTTNGTLDVMNETAPGSAGSDRAKSPVSMTPQRTASQRSLRKKEVHVAAPQSDVMPSPPPVNPEALLQLAAACRVVLKEQGLDTEAAGFVIQLLVLKKDAMYIPLAVGLVSHCIPVSSSQFRPSMEFVLQMLLDRLKETSDKFADGSNVSFSMLQHILTTAPSKVQDPTSILAYFRQQLSSQLHRQGGALLRGASSILATTRNAMTFERMLGDSKLLASRSHEERDEERLELQSYFFLKRDVSLTLGEPSRDSLLIHCVLYVCRLWLLALLRALSDEVRCEPSRWDVSVASTFGDLVTAVQQLSGVRLDLALHLNRLLSTLLDENTLPPGCGPSAQQLLELFGKESQSSTNAVIPILQLIMNKHGYRIRSASSPVSLLSIPFLTTLHDACFKVCMRQLQLLKLTEPRKRSAQVVEDDPRREPQLECSKEIFLCGEIALELMSAWRYLHVYSSVQRCNKLYLKSTTTAERSTSPSSNTRYPHTVATLFGFAAAESSGDGGGDGSGMPPSILNRKCLPSDLIERVAAVFNPTLLSAQNLFRGVQELATLYILDYSSMVAKIEVMGNRFPIQRVDIWHLLLRLATVLYEVEVDVTAPLEDPTSAHRTDNQLKELQKLLSTILHLAKTNIGAMPNQEELESQLMMYTQRLQWKTGQQLSKPIASSAAGALLPDIAQVSSVTVMTHSGNVPPPQTGSRQAHATSRAEHSSNDSKMDPLHYVGISRVDSTMMSRRPGHLLDDPEPHFEITPKDVHQGDAIRVRWTLPTRVPPRFAAVGVFVDDEGINDQLILGRALELHKGLRFRDWHGDEDIRAPMRSGLIRVAFFLTAHSEGLAVPGFSATIRVHARSNSALPLLRHEKRQQLLKEPEVDVVTIQPSVSMFSPCDLRKSFVQREEALVKRALRASSQLSQYPHKSSPEVTPLRSSSSFSKSDTSMVVATMSRSESTLTKKPSAITMVVKDTQSLEASVKLGEAKYRKSLRTIKGTLEAAGTLVVIVGPGAQSFRR